jgi:hypothetical protein
MHPRTHNYIGSCPATLNALVSRDVLLRRVSGKKSRTGTQAMTIPVALTASFIAALVTVSLLVGAAP